MAAGPSDEAKRAFMREALAEAQKALDDLEVPVGCVIVRDSDGRIIARGHNNTVATGNATRHAEFEAIDAALRDSGPDTQVAAELFGACTIYVTCEPCVMCAAALRFAGFKRVCFGCRNDKFGGCGSALPVHSGPQGGADSLEIEEGLFCEEAIVLLRSFYSNENAHAPQPRKKRTRAGGPSPAPGESGELLAVPDLAPVEAGVGR
jgi:tRNA-specific adenosine deaminase 2